MTGNSQPRILVIGAGSMGIITGYHLTLAKADVTFLVRPHRAQDLNRPQILYCYEDNQLKEYSGYKYITDPSEIKTAGAPGYDFIVIALDGASLKSETGVALVKAMGEAARKTKTKVILGSVFFNLRPWFLDVSGLAGDQVTNGHLDIHAYPPSRLTLPSENQEVIAKADFAYTDKLGHGFTVDDSAPAVAAAFAELYGASGVSGCIVASAAASAVAINALFPVFAACELLGWPKLRDVGCGANAGLWTQLVVPAVREIQGLGVHGEAGRKAAEGKGLVAELGAWEQHMLPLDLQAFNRFHHGDKLRAQGREHLRACLEEGRGEGKEMRALEGLLGRLGEGEGEGGSYFPG
ncbi:uncharacterized protein GGS25DRAFT_534982 [Hypoxylon fragiforme]|uniref:uncharacterized protein n=1 Tax=Hypoxylon fragiforme TaxID=63214 RepID=UPI0020C67CCC|nr:uncharacterized protein GGS25DRAFT_534982 [Hypoxylon fragiforme]KAI2604539.1 hypothetical protein GGS25DRAFT_534982 [Hypoxylon fragiforme]